MSDDPDIFSNFLKKIMQSSLGINTTMLYVDYWVYRASVFDVIRVTRSWFDEKRLKCSMTRIFSKTFWKINAAQELMLVISIWNTEWIGEAVL